MGFQLDDDARILLRIITSNVSENMVKGRSRNTKIGISDGNSKKERENNGKIIRTFGVKFKMLLSTYLSIQVVFVFERIRRESETSLDNL